MSQQYDEAIIDVEKRKKSSEYNLGDPTLFPPEFLAWIKRYIEQSGIQLPASTIFGSLVPVVGSVAGMAPGIVLAYAGPTAPPGSLSCNGQSVGRTAYARLFAVLGITYGAVDGSTFNLPDYRDRTLFGVGSQLTAVTDNDGMVLGTRGPHHNHTVTDPGHFHNVPNVRSGGTGMSDTPAFNAGPSTPSTNTDTKTTGIFVGAGGPTKPMDTPAYHGILYVITTG
jgi:microcystin-dependent protein